MYFLYYPGPTILQREWVINYSLTAIFYRVVCFLDFGHDLSNLAWIEPANHVLLITVHNNILLLVVKGRYIFEV